MANPIHWKSGLMAINPEMLVQEPASIEKAVYDRTGDGHNLYLHVRRMRDSSVSVLPLAYDHWDIPEDAEWTDPGNPALEAIDRVCPPKSIQRLYEDFGVQEHSEFAGTFPEHRILGVYFANVLVGIKRWEPQAPAD